MTGTAHKAGWLAVIGLGPGADDLQAPLATQTLAHATDLLGYAPYLARVPQQEGQRRHASDNREELARACHALELAQGGARVAVVSAGDAGVFGMASAVFEAMEHGDAAWRDLDVRVIPGISALLAAAARLGAPLGHDFCAISLSDNLKPFDLVLKRVRLAAEAGLVMAFYNPVSRARPWQLDAVFDLLRTALPGTVPVAFATAISRADEAMRIETLQAARGTMADMRTLILVGTAESRVLPHTRGTYLYTPRGVAAGAAC